jgi:putative heme-binding domain-containing protein
MRRLLGLVAMTVLVSGSLVQAEPPAKSRGLDALVQILISADDAAIQRDVLRGIHEALQGRTGLTAPAGWDAVRTKLAKSSDAEIREKVQTLSVLFGNRAAIAEMRKTVTDSAAPASVRRTGLQSLIEAQTPDLLPLLRDLLNDRTLRSQALHGLAANGDDRTPDLVVNLYPTLDEAEKADALAVLASRPTWCRKLLDAMEKGSVPRRDLSPFTARQIVAQNDKGLTERLTKVWGNIRKPAGDKAELMSRYLSIVPPDALKKADRVHGRAVFTKNCATCHTLFGEGAKIGPDLTGSQRTNPEYVLSKVLDPNAVVARDYNVTLVTTKRGRSVTGLLKEEDDKTLALQTPNELIRIAKSDIEDRKVSTTSLMPEGLLAMLAEDEIRDLFAYLVGADQVPLPKSEKVLLPKTDADATAKYFEDRLSWWLTWNNSQKGSGTTCISCHTAGPLSLARPALGKPSNTDEKVIASIKKRVANWDTIAGFDGTDEEGLRPFYGNSKSAVAKMKEALGTESVLNALLLVNHDIHGNDGKLGEPTRTALTILWKTQRDDGGWTWLDFGIRPWERDGEYFGASMAAIAVGSAGKTYFDKEIPETDRKKLDKLRDYIKKKYEKQPLHNRLFALWASSVLPDLLPPETRKKLIDEVLKAQSEDGGWHFQKLGQMIDGENDWEIKASKPKDAMSDGFATALAVLALKRAGVAPDNPALRKGLAWLVEKKVTQGEAPVMYPNKDRDPTSHTGRFLRDAAAAYAVLALADVKVP